MPLKVVKRKGRGSWYLRGTVGKETIFESTGTDSRAHADAIRIKRENEILDRHTFGAKATATFIEAAVSYLEMGGEARFLGRFDERTGKWSLLIGHFGSTKLDLIDQIAIDSASRLLYPGRKPSTVKRQVYVPMAAVLHHGASRNLTHYRRIEHPRVVQPPTDWAQPEWFEAFWPCCTPKLRALTTFLPYTGCRISEALGLAPDDVSLKEGWAHIRKTKNQDARTVHLPAIVVAELANLSWGEDQVFAYSSHSVVGHEIDRAIGKANKDRKAEGLNPIKRLTSHQLGSHTYGTWMRNYAGQDAKGLMGTGRWKNEKSVHRYVHTTVSEESRRSDLLPVPNPGQSKRRAAK